MFDQDAEGAEAVVTADVLGGLVAAAAERLDAAAHLDLTEVDATDLAAAVRTLEQMRRSLDATVGHALAELHQRRATTTTAALATSRWLAREAALPQGVARRRLSTTLTLQALLPAADQALTDRRIGFDHAHVLADAVNERNADAFALAAPELIAAAPRTAFARWRRDVQAVAELLDPDGPHDPTGDLAANQLHLSPSDRLMLLRGELTGDDAVTVEHIIETRTDELYLRYSRDREQFPDQPIPTRATLRALALVELLREAHGTDPDSTRPPRTDATIVIHPDAAPDDPANPTGTRQGHPGPAVTTPDGKRLSTPAASLLVCTAMFHVLLTTVTDSGTPIAESTGYRPSRALRRALEHRDGGCTFPGCTAKLTWCDAHHLTPWPGGRTEQTNLVVVCRTHHRYAHHRHWNVTLTPDGWTIWTNPTGHTRWGQRHSTQRAGPPPQQDSRPAPQK
jgi:hypothetical protein